MYWAVAGFAGVVSFGILVLSRNRIYILTRATVGLLNGMLADVSDEEKQKLLIAGLGKVLSNLVLTLLLVSVAVGSLVVILYCYSLILDTPFVELDVSSSSFYLALAAGSVIPFIPLMLKKSSSGYSESARLLHQIILDNQNLGKSLFRFESNSFLKENTDSEPQSLIVSGLARAGTTALTTQLHEIGDFYSLSYANMPFLMAPNLWSKIYKPKDAKKTERSHGDGVEFGLDSVEALEEYFWKSQLSDSFIESDHLVEHQVDETTSEAYKNYQKLVRKASDSGSIYLAKNNNMMLRYESVKNHCKDMNIILLIRKPLDHANSLLKQHQRFCAMQKEDPFVLEYMDWLGHHEFGLNQKEFQFNGQESAGSNKDSIDFWVSVWVNYYSAVRQYLSDEQITLIRYEDFLQDPSKVFQSLKTGLSLPLQERNFEKFIPKPSELPTPKNHKKLDEANRIYEETTSS